jgi:hypothetical protein
MTMDAEELLAQEAAAWGDLLQTLEAVPDARLEQPGVTPDGWTVKDVLVHVAGWLEACAEVLETGAWDLRAQEVETPEHVERVNAGHVERARGMTPDRARNHLELSRERARAAMGVLGTATPDAWAWFEESGPMHYAKHRHDLVAWLAGVPSDPRVGSLLQTEAEDWVGFASILHEVDPTAALTDPPGWTAHDVAFHVARWLETAAADVEADRGWAHDDDPEEAALVDAMNDGWLAEGRGLAPDEVRTRLGRARARLRAALAALASPSEEALGWCEANTVEHYAEHLPHLRAALPGRATGDG